MKVLIKSRAPIDWATIGRAAEEVGFVCEPFGVEIPGEANWQKLALFLSLLDVRATWIAPGSSYRDGAGTVYSDTGEWVLYLENDYD